MEKYKMRLSRSFSMIGRKSITETDPSENGSSWKFWRRLSVRGRNEHGKSSTLHRKGRPEIVLLEKPEPLSEDGLDQPSCGNTLSNQLPDVVEKAPPRLPRFNSNAVPPPKPPRLFLIRTPSTNSSKHSSDAPDTDATYMNCERVAELRSQLQDTSLEDNQQSSPPLNNNAKDIYQTNISDNNNVVCKSSNQYHFDIEPQYQQISELSRSPNGGPSQSGISVSSNGQRLNSSSSSRSHSTSSTTTPQNPKIVTPEMRAKRAGRRRRSSEKGDITRQRHVMNHVAELLRQRLDPYPLLDPLRRGGVITKTDVQAFISQRDRKSVCERLVNIVGDGNPTVLNTFCDALASSGNATEILEVLNVMREMDRIVHEESHNSPAEGTVLAEEKNLTFDVGYLAPDLSLKPLVELERVRASGDKRLSKTSSRASAYSLLEADSSTSSDLGSEVGIYPGLLMVSICVTGHSLSGQRSAALAHLLQAQNCVSELHLGKTQLAGEDVAVLVDTLQVNSTVHSLDIRLNTLDDLGARSVAKLLLNTKTLRFLNLSSTCLSPEGLQTVAQAAAGNKTLIDLDLSFLDINDASCDSLRDLVRSGVSVLQKLRLRNNNIGWSGCYVLAEGLFKNRCLNVLDLSRNNIGDEGLQALSKFLPDSSVTELYLENCGLTSNGCERLCELVTHCKRLKHLDVSTNTLTDSGISKLAPALERTSSLQNLSLNMCGVTNDGFSKLLDVLEKNTSIVHMKLCYNKLGNDHVNPDATADNLRYRLRIVTSSKPKLKILLWGNSFEES